MNNKLSAVVSVTVGFLLTPGLLWTHHSDAEFNQEKIVERKGTVTKFEFINPHTILHFDVKDDKGNVEHWSAYAGPPNRMAREVPRWNSRTLKPGDEITITGSPSRYGRKIMNVMRVVRSSGEVLREMGDLRNPDRARR